MVFSLRTFPEMRFFPLSGRIYAGTPWLVVWFSPEKPTQVKGVSLVCALFIPWHLRLAVAAGPPVLSDLPLRWPLIPSSWPSVPIAASQSWRWWRRKRPVEGSGAAWLWHHRTDEVLSPVQITAVIHHGWDLQGHSPPLLLDELDCRYIVSSIGLPDNNGWLYDLTSKPELITLPIF